MQSTDSTSLRLKVVSSVRYIDIVSSYYYYYLLIESWATEDLSLSSLYKSFFSTLSLSEVKIYRHGNYTVSEFSNHINGFPALGGGRGGKEEAVDDLLHLLSPFALVHNKGSVCSLSIPHFLHFSFNPSYRIYIERVIKDLPPIPTHTACSELFLLTRNPFLLVGTLQSCWSWILYYDKRLSPFLSPFSHRLYKW